MSTRQPATKSSPRWEGSRRFPRHGQSIALSGAGSEHEIGDGHVDVTTPTQQLPDALIDVKKAGAGRGWAISRVTERCDSAGAHQ